MSQTWPAALHCNDCSCKPKGLRSLRQGFWQVRCAFWSHKEWAPKHFAWPHNMWRTYIWLAFIESMVKSPNLPASKLLIFNLFLILVSCFFITNKPHVSAGEHQDIQGETFLVRWTQPSELSFFFYSTGSRCNDYVSWNEQSPVEPNASACSDVGASSGWWNNEFVLKLHRQTAFKIASTKT